MLHFTPAWSSPGKPRSRSNQQTYSAGLVGQCTLVDDGVSRMLGSHPAPRQQFQHVERIPPGCNILRLLEGSGCAVHTVNRVDGPQNLAVNLRARARGKWVGLSRNKIESGWLPTQRERIIMQCAKVAPNLPESGITYQFLVSPEHHPSAAVHPPISVGEERSSPSHCNGFRQRSSPFVDRRRAWCGATLEDPEPIRGQSCQARILPMAAMRWLVNNSIVALASTAWS